MGYLGLRLSNLTRRGGGSLFRSIVHHNHIVLLRTLLLLGTDLLEHPTMVGRLYIHQIK